MDTSQMLMSFTASHKYTLVSFIVSIDKKKLNLPSFL